MIQAIKYLILFCLLIPSNEILNEKPEVDNVKKLYAEIGLKNLLEFKIFEYAVEGFSEIDNLKKSNILTIIDFSKPSTKKRFFIIDLNKKELILKSLVAHGKNSGENYTSNFSNTSRSLKSCLGFYLTAETYYGKHGYSLRLDGLENDINDNSRERSIVIHGADYVSCEFAKKHGRLGRSWGCPAVPVKLSKKIIDLISNGSCLFIYANDQNYIKKSEFIN